MRKTGIMKKEEQQPYDSKAAAYADVSGLF
jgi:hypothetical protein